MGWEVTRGRREGQSELTVAHCEHLDLTEELVVVLGGQLGDAVGTRTVHENDWVCAEATYGMTNNSR